MKLLSLFIYLSCITIIFGQTPDLIIPAQHAKSLRYITSTHKTDLVISAGYDSTVKIWRAKDMLLLKNFLINEVTDLQVSIDDKYLSIATKDEVHIVDLNSLSLLRKIEKHGYVAAFGPTVDVVYTVKELEEVFKIFETNILNGKSREIGSFLNINKKSSYPLRLSVSPKNDYILLYDSKKTAVLTSLKDGKSYSGTKDVFSFLPNGNLLYIQESKNSFIVGAKSIDNKILWTANPINNTKGIQYNYNFLAIDEKTKEVFVEINDGILHGNYETGSLKLSPITTTNNNGISCLAILGGNYLITQEKESNELLGILRSDYSTRYFDNSQNSIAPTSLVGSKGSKSFVMSNYAGATKLAIVTKNGLSLYDIQANLKAQTLAISDDGDMIAGVSTFANEFFTARKKNNFSVTKKKFFEKASNSESFYDNLIAISSDKKYVGFRNKYNAFVFNTATLTETFKKFLPLGGDGYLFDYKTGFALNNKQLALMEYETGESKTGMYDIATGKQIWIKNDKSQMLAFSASDETLYSFNFHPSTLREFKSKNGNIASETEFEIRPGLTTSSINQTGTLLVTEKNDVYDKDKNDLLVYNLETKKLVHTLKGHKSRINNVTFISDDFILSSSYNNEILLWNGKTGKILGSLVIFKSNDWVFMTPDGRFDGSQAALSKMYYTVGRTMVPLERLFENFYTPNLLTLSMEGKVPPASPIAIDDVKQPPTVNLHYEQGTRNLTVEDDTTIETVNTINRDAKIIVRAKAPNDKVSEIRLYQNGKLLTNKVRNLTVEDDVTENPDEKIFYVALQPGENSFKAVSLNSQRTESAPATLSVTLNDKSEKPILGGIQLHLLVVGINEYKNPKYNLNYAVADATSFQEAIKFGMSDITSKVNVHFISNAEASKENIFKAFKEIVTIANPQDIFIFFYAGHGMMTEDSLPEFFLVPYDVTQIYGNEGGIKQKGISATELKQLSSTIQAQKQLFVLDACQSAGALNSVATRGAGEEKAIAQLARSTGTHWITASGSQQFATEFDQLGHGVFTYVLLDALKGKADSGDGRVTVNEVKAYLESQVPEISKKYNGSPQYPSSFSFGQDFPVGVKKN